MPEVLRYMISLEPLPPLNSLCAGKPARLAGGSLTLDSLALRTYTCNWKHLLASVITIKQPILCPAHNANGNIPQRARSLARVLVITHVITILRILLISSATGGRKPNVSTYTAWRSDRRPPHSLTHATTNASRTPLKS